MTHFRVGRDPIQSITYPWKNPYRIAVMRTSDGKWCVFKAWKRLGSPFAKHSQAVRWAHNVALSEVREAGR